MRNPRFPLAALTISLALAACAGSGSTAVSPGEARQPASTDQPSPLDFSSFEGAHRGKLDAFFSGKAEATFTQVKEILSGYDSDFEGAGLVATYQFETLRWLGVPQGAEGFDFEAWASKSEKNRRMARGMRLYVDDPADDSEQIWRSINRGLRKGQLPPKLRAPMDDILFALNHLPSIKGYLFRGTYLPLALLREAEKAPAVTVEPGFTSTSVSAAVAVRFANQLEATALSGDRINTLLIIRGQGARPVSIFHREHSHELEGLLAPGARFRLLRVIYDRPAQPRNALVFAELLSAEGTR